LAKEDNAMTRNNVRAGFAIVVLFLCASMAGADEKWSDWIFTNNASIQWRWKDFTYGRDIPPNCNFEFNNRLGGKASFKYVASYSWVQAGILDEKKGSAWEITETEHGGVSIDKCTRVLTITISDLKKTN
jgi:hypothetical protein